MRSALLLPVLLLAACQRVDPNAACDGRGLDESTDLAPDFCLVDLNTRSVREGETVSPRDYLEQVSGWYFIHST